MRTMGWVGWAVTACISVNCVYVVSTLHSRNKLVAEQNKEIQSLMEIERLQDETIHLQKGIIDIQRIMLGQQTKETK